MVAVKDIRPTRKVRNHAEQRASLISYIMLGVMVGGRLGFMLLYDLEAPRGPDAIL